MQMTFVKYRTKDEMAMPSDVKRHWHSGPHYAVVPTMWLSDLLQWLSDIGAKVIGTTDNFDHEARLPITWPSYETCSYGIKVSDAIHCVL